MPWAQEPSAGQQQPRLPGSLRTTPMLDAWLRVDAGGITVFTGKAELGQGIKTALLQVAAEELAVDTKQIELITADTAKTPNEGYTAGSQSMQDSATAIRHAAAQARELLIGAAAARFGVPGEQLTAKDAAVTTADGRSASYGDLASADLLHVEAQPQSKLKSPGTYRLIGTSDASRRYPREGDWRRRLRAGSAPARHGACTRRPPAELRVRACAR